MLSAVPLLATAVRRDLLAVLARPDEVSVPAATAHVEELPRSGARRPAGARS